MARTVDLTKMINDNPNRVVKTNPVGSGYVEGFELPVDDGTNGQVITSDGLGGTAWTDKSAATVQWSDVQNKPSEFPPESHDHEWSEIQNTPATYAPSAHQHPWGDITDRPTTYPPTAHDHDDRYYTETEIDSMLSGSGGVSKQTTVTVGYADLNSGNPTNLFSLPSKGVVLDISHQVIESFMATTNLTVGIDGEEELFYGSFDISNADFVFNFNRNGTLLPGNSGVLNATGSKQLKAWATSNTWSAGPATLTAKWATHGDGVPDNMIHAAGESISGSDLSTERYDGASWTSTQDVSSKRLQGVLGGNYGGAILTTGEDPGVVDYTDTQIFNGNSWSSSSSFPQALIYAAGCGDPSAALVAGGEMPNGSLYGPTNEFNGSIWATGNNLSTSLKNGACCGSSSAALLIGGRGTLSSQKYSFVQEYNGTIWSQIQTLNKDRNHGVAGGTVDSAFVCAGISEGVYALTTEYFNGTVWKTSSNHNIDRRYAGGGGGSSSGTLMQGNSNTAPSGTNSVEFYQPGNPVLAQGSIEFYITYSDPS